MPKVRVAGFGVSVDARPIPGVGHDYIHMLNEVVDPASGNLSFKIDLPVPKGRGLTIPLSITYNSGEVFRFSSLETGCGGLGTTRCSNASQLPRTTNGWSDTFPYVTMGLMSATIPGYSTPTCRASVSYVFYDPFGESHMLGLSQVTPNVQCESAFYNPTDCSNQNGQTGGTYCSAGYSLEARWVGGDDQVFAQSPPSCTAGGSEGTCPNGDVSPFTVTDASGTTYYFPGLQELFPSYIEDRNGNVIRVASNSNSVLPVSLTDTLGRNVITISGTPPLPSTYQAGALTYGVTWGTTTANFATTGSQLPFVIPVYQQIGVGCVATFSVADSALNEITALNFPNGQQYKIQYDPRWGLPSQITYPDGGWVKYTWKTSDTANTLATFDGGAGGYPPLFGACNYVYAAPVVATRTVGYASGVTAESQTFSYYTCWNSSSASPTCPSNPDPNSPGNTNTSPNSADPTDPRVWQWKATKVVTTNYLPNNTSETATTYYT